MVLKMKYQLVQSLLGKVVRASFGCSVLMDPGRMFKGELGRPKDDVVVGS